MEYEMSSTIEIDVEVIGSINPGDPGRYHGPPENCYPAEPAHVEDISIILRKSRKTIDITEYLPKTLIDSLMDDLIEDASTYEQDMKDLEADRRYEEWRDRDCE